MRLYVSAKTKNKIGYTPDWLKVSYEEDNQELELTLDIRGEIDYEKDGLNCRCKGDLEPWVLYNCESGDEVDLTELDEEEVEEMFPITKIVEILKNGTYYRLGVYPVNATDETFELAEADRFTNCEAECDIYDGKNEHQICFTLNEIEINN